MSTVGGDDVLLALLAALRERVPPILLDLNERAPDVVELDGRAATVLLDPVKQWRLVADFDADLADGQLPQVALDSTGWQQAPGRRASRGGTGSVVWSVVATVLQRGRTTAQTLVRTQRYVTALVDAGLACEPLQIAGRWCDVLAVETAYDELLPAKSRRTLGAGFVEFQVTVPNALDPVAAPTDPAGEPPVVVRRALTAVTVRRPPPVDPGVYSDVLTSVYPPSQPAGAAP